MSIAPSHLTAGLETAAGASSTSASITPTANTLVIVWVGEQDDGAGGAPGSISVSGCGITWTSFGSQTATGGAHGDYRIEGFYGYAASPSTGALTITGDSDIDVRAWGVAEYPGARLQAPTNVDGDLDMNIAGTANPTGALSALTDALSIVAIGGFGEHGGFGGSNMTGHTQLGSTQSTGNIDFLYGYDTTDTTPTVNWTRAFGANSDGVLFCCELEGVGPAAVVIGTTNVDANGEATTAQLTAPSGKTTGDFDAGEVYDDKITSDAITVSADDYTEVGWIVQLTSDAEAGSTYQFRVVKGDGTVLDTYSVTPQVTYGTTHALAAAVAAGGTVAGNISITRGLAGALGGTSSVAIGDLEVTRHIAALIAGSSTLAGDLDVNIALQALVASVGTVAADLRPFRGLTATCAATSTLTAQIQLEIALNAVVSAQGTVAGAMEVQYALAALVAASGSVSASLAVSRPLAALVAAASSVIADMEVVKVIAGQVDATSTITADAHLFRGLAASVDGASAVVADLTVELVLAALVNASSAVSADLGVTRDIQALIAAASSISADMGVTVPVAAQIDGASTVVVGDMGVTRGLAGLVNGASSISAETELDLALAAALNGSSTVAITGDLDVQRPLAAAIAATSAVAADLYVEHPIAIEAALNATSTVTALLTSTRTLDAAIAAQSTIAAETALSLALQAAIAGQSSIVALFIDNALDLLQQAADTLTVTAQSDADLDEILSLARSVTGDSLPRAGLIDVPNLTFDANVSAWANDNGAVISWDGTHDRQGDPNGGAMKVTLTTAEGSYAGARMSTASAGESLIQAVQGDTVEASVWVDLDGWDGDIALNFYEYIGSTYNSISSARFIFPILDADGYTRCSFQHTVQGASTTHLRLDIDRYEANVARVFWVDDVDVDMVDSPTDGAFTPTVLSADSLTLTPV